MVSLALSTLRARWALFAGTFLALSLGVALIAATGQVLDATRGTSKPGGPGRYDAAAVVVRAGQSFTVGFGSGDGAYDERRTATSRTAWATCGGSPTPSVRCPVCGGPSSTVRCPHGW